jgi:hypothetical protein
MHGEHLRKVVHANQVARQSSSSGGRSLRNARYSAKSYATFVPTPITRGAENAKFCMAKPATLEPTAQKHCVPGW